MKNIQSTKTAKMNEYIKAAQKQITRIYIDRYLPARLTVKTDDGRTPLEKLAPYYRKTTTSTDIFSHEGLFRIENGSSIVKLNTVDKPIIRKTDPSSFGSLTLLVDPSLYEKEPVLSQLPYEHTSNSITSMYYSCVPQVKEPKLMLIIDGHVNKQFVPTNIYFLATEDIDHLLIKEELVELMTALF